MNEQGEASNTLNFPREEMEKRMSEMASTVLTKFRQEEKLCDVVIKTGDVEFNAHKIILCTCSSYFRTLFTGPWATSKKHVYTIPGVSPEMMHLIIDYAYTHSVPVTEANVAEVLAAADQFLVPGIIQSCCFFLEDQLCLGNCIGIWRLLDFYHCPELRHKVFLYVLHHFEEIVCVSRELLDLSVQQLAAVIENDQLNVKIENTVLEVILRWINHLPDQRQGHTSALLSRVRLGLMTIASFQNVTNNVMRNSIECIPIITDVMTALMDFRLRRSKYLYLQNRPRLPSAILLATGGKDGSVPVTSLEAYDVRADCWVTVSTEEIWRAHHGVAVVNNFVYLLGGCNHIHYLNTVQKFDPVTRTWHEVAPMNFRRCNISVAVQDGCIYAMGGFNGQTCNKTVECYEPETNQWTIVAPMRTRRCSAGSTTLNGKVYICGGYDGRRSLSTAERYDPNIDQWTTIANMSSCRSGLGVAAYRGRIYAIGGINNRNSCLFSVEAYNPQTNMWSPVPSIHRPRSYFGIGVLEDQLFVVGGYNGFTTLLTVERYDVEAGIWHMASWIGTPRSGLSCCVLHGLYNVAQDWFSRDSMILPNVEEVAGGSV